MPHRLRLNCSACELDHPLPAVSIAIFIDQYYAFGDSFYEDMQAQRSWCVIRAAGFLVRVAPRATGLVFKSSIIPGTLSGGVQPPPS